MMLSLMATMMVWLLETRTVQRSVEMRVSWSAMMMVSLMETKMVWLLETRTVQRSALKKAHSLV